MQGAFQAPLGGSGCKGLQRGPVIEKILSVMYKCAVFDIKPTHNHQIFIPGVQLHSPKFYLVGEQWWADLRLVGGMPPSPAFPLEPPLYMNL